MRSSSTQILPAMSEYKYSLQKYTGRGSRHTCPACGRPHCFTLYVDAMGNPLAGDVGRCEHVNSCGYEKTPRMYFDENPQERGRHNTAPSYTQPKKEAQPDYIPFSLIRKSEGMASNLVGYLAKYFKAGDLKTAVAQYHLGCTRKGETIFPQIDRLGMCRTGKVMQYGADGHRVKGDFDAVDWLHARYMKKQGKAAHEFHLKQCLFGEHLLPKRPEDTVCITESEKAAVIASMVFPSCVWVSCGGKHGLSPERCKPLAGRRVVVFPDADAMEEWTAKTKALGFCRSVRLSDWAKDEPQGSKRDIADLILEEKARSQAKPTTIGDVLRWNQELGFPKERFSINV